MGKQALSKREVPVFIFLNVSSMTNPRQTEYKLAIFTSISLFIQKVLVHWLVIIQIYVDQESFGEIDERMCTFMVEIAKELRANVQATLTSGLPMERKQSILRRLIDQAEVLSSSEPDTLSSSVSALTEEERHAIQEALQEAVDAAKNLLEHT